jgi:uncharacterized protein (TIGR02145 family)
MKNLLLIRKVFPSFIIFCSVLFSLKVNAQNNSPVVSNVIFHQRLDSSFKVDIYYDVTDPAGNLLTISVQTSSDAGQTWALPVTSVTGDVGTNVTGGTGKHIIWNFGVDDQNFFSDKIQIQITAVSIVPCPGTPTVTYAGKTYNTVLIGTQCWLRENLNVGTRINGSSDQTNNNIIEKYCYNDDENNCTTYGGLYQWAEAVQYQNGANNTSSTNPAFTGNVQGICPSGWHIPTQAEFQTLETAVNNDGNSLKAVGQGTGPGAGTNTNGFSALFAGTRGGGSGFYGLGDGTYFWSSTECYINFTYFMGLAYGPSDVNLYYYTKQGGFSVRCCKDDAVPVPNSPIQLQPGKGSTNVPISPIFIWKKSNFAASYTLQVATDSLFINMNFNQSGITDTTKGITELSNLTKYFWRVSAVNGSGTSAYSQVWSFITIPASFTCGSQITYAGKTYNTILIGTQCWLKENLNVGTMILGSQEQTNNGIIEKYCYNDSTLNCDKYGGLYNWDEAMQYLKTEGTKGICLAGWHIPKFAEYKILGSTVGKDTNSYLAIGQASGTNTSGFSALLAGFHSPTYSQDLRSYYGWLGIGTSYWSSLEQTEMNANAWYPGIGDTSDYSKNFGISIRCLKDETTAVSGNTDN